jgi:hypothetical protein
MPGMFNAGNYREVSGEMLKLLSFSGADYGKS